MIPSLSQKSVLEIASLLADDAPVGDKWNANPWFQRDLVWDLRRKQKLIDSLKKGMPFGMVWTWTHVDNGVRLTDIIDGKQRCMTLVSFMRDEFRDDHGLHWSEWSTREQIYAGARAVSVQGVRLEEGENESTVVELFRRINTQSKQLTTGQLLKSCDKEGAMRFLNMVFFDDIEDSSVYPFFESIVELRNKWGSVFCKTGFNIKTNASNGELTFLTGLVVPLLTGNNEAITTSFDILNMNGLRDTVTNEMKIAFFEKMCGDDGFLDIVQCGYEENQFKRSAKGFPNFGKTTPIIYLVNRAYAARTDDAQISDGNGDSLDCAELISQMQEFFKKLDEDEDLEEEWKNRFRKNRNIGALRSDVEFIRDTVALE